MKSIICFFPAMTASLFVLTANAGDFLREETHHYLMLAENVTASCPGHTADYKRAEALEAMMSEAEARKDNIISSVRYHESFLFRPKDFFTQKIIMETNQLKELLIRYKFEHDNEAYAIKTYQYRNRHLQKGHIPRHAYFESQINKITKQIATNQTRVRNIQKSQQSSWDSRQQDKIIDRIRGTLAPLRNLAGKYDLLIHNTRDCIAIAEGTVIYAKDFSDIANRDSSSLVQNLSTPERTGMKLNYFENKLGYRTGIPGGTPAGFSAK